MVELRLGVLGVQPGEPQFVPDEEEDDDAQSDEQLTRQPDCLVRPRRPREDEIRMRRHEPAA